MQIYAPPSRWVSSVCRSIHADRPAWQKVALRQLLLRPLVAWYVVALRVHWLRNGVSGS